jgi:hypothetical protein
MSSFEFETSEDLPVCGPDGKTPVGVVRPGTIYEAESRSGGWLVMRGPDGSVGYVAENRVRLLTVPTPPETPEAPADAGALQTAEGPSESSRRDKAKRKRSRTLLLVLVGLAIIGGGGAAAFILTGDDGSDNSESFRAEPYRIEGRRLDGAFVHFRDGEFVSYLIDYSDEDWCGGGIYVPGFADGEDDRVIWDNGVLTGEVRHEEYVWCDPSAGSNWVLVRPELRIEGDVLVGKVDIVYEATGELRYSFEVGG